ncbi:HSP20-like chaperone [Sphaerosporella brunnea]|uniref:HSP20-like chaperone n=1 Tax=Sphaerosporella brunnea TaxID=1250544 RepID=A0A5J5EN74_9PEZI|nr:HSP20-like chaperone [Sphaerosporella brunnea]
MSATVTPEVLWAQRSSADDADKNIIYLTITAPDIPKESLKVGLTPEKLTFNAESKSKKYAVELEFYAEIDVEHSKQHHSGRGIEFVLRKKEAKTEYWPRLLKEPRKLQFIKTDFDRWVDEDEQEEAEDLAPPGGGGMGDMGGFDFSQMMGGAGGMGGMDMSKLMGGAGGMDLGEEDEDMPELEAVSKPAETAGEKEVTETVGEEEATGTEAQEAK